MELKQNELLHDLETKDRKIKDMEYQHEERIQTTQQRIEELELKQNELQHNIETKDRKKKSMKFRHELVLNGLSRCNTNIQF